MGFCGTCMETAIRQGLPPLQTCGNYEAFTQLDFSYSGRDSERGSRCHILYSQLSKCVPLGTKCSELGKIRQATYAV